MKLMASFFQRYALPIFFVLTFGIFWAATPLAPISFLLPALIASFAPALVALAVAAITEGNAGAAALLRRLFIWRVGPWWYAAALGIPVVVSLAIVGLSLLLGPPGAARIGPLSPLLLILFIFAAGEELGWRGYALPRLLSSRPPLAVALFLGVIHAWYHAPLWWSPGFPTPAYSFGAFLATSLGFGVLWTWLYQQTQGSVLIATLFHGAINAAGNVFFAGIPSAQLSWLLPVGFVVAAFVVLAVSGLNLSRKPIAQVEAV